MNVITVSGVPVSLTRSHYSINSLIRLIQQFQISLQNSGIITPTHKSSEFSEFSEFSEASFPATEQSLLARDRNLVSEGSEIMEGFEEDDKKRYSESRKHRIIMRELKSLCCKHFKLDCINDFGLGMYIYIFM